MSHTPQKVVELMYKKKSLSLRAHARRTKAEIITLHDQTLVSLRKPDLRRTRPGDGGGGHEGEGGETVYLYPSLDRLGP